MNKIEFFWKKTSIIFMTDCFTQSVFNKNYNRITELFNKNQVNKVLSITSNDLVVTFEVTCKDGLIINLDYAIEKC